MSTGELAHEVSSLATAFEMYVERLVQHRAEAAEPFEDWAEAFAAVFDNPNDADLRSAAESTLETLLK